MEARNLLARAFRVFKKEGFLCLVGAIVQYTIEDSWIGRSYVRFRYGKNLVLKEIQGSKMYLNPLDPGINRELLVRKVHEKGATKILREILSEGMRVVDIGANIGYYALIEAQIVGKKGKVYAIEPEPNNFELLNRNVQVNNFEYIIETFQIAIADKEGEDKLYISNKSNLHSLLPHSLISNSQNNYITVKTMTLDNFLRDKYPIDFIRMDVEGFEYNIIKGATNTLKRTKNIKLFIEFHPIEIEAQGISLKAFIELLNNFGFEPIAVAKKRSNKIYRNVSTEELYDYIISGGYHVFLEKG